jgi:hypothetical protein
LGYIDIEISKEIGFFKQLENIYKDPNIESVDINTFGSYNAIQVTPNDPQFANQWYINRIKARNSWNHTMGSECIVVGVLDSGVDWEHEDLGIGHDTFQNIWLNPEEDFWSNQNNPNTGNGIDDGIDGLIDNWKGWNYDLNSNDVRTTNDHGTQVSGIISAKANNGRCDELGFGRLNTYGALTADALKIANQYQESGLVKFAHPNFLIAAEPFQGVPNDPYFDNQFYLRNTGQVFNPVENHAGTAGADISALGAWDVTMGNNEIVVAVLDEGVTANHPDLPNARQVRLNGSNFVGGNANDPSPVGNQNHGNACAGMIAATGNNGQGISGIAPNVRIMPVRMIGATIANTASSILFAADNGAHIISASWGYQSDNPNFIPVIVSAIQYAVTQGRGGLGAVVVFAAGNTASHNQNDPGFVSFPSNVNIPGVFTVGASDRDDLQADYSPTSDANAPTNQIIDIVAPSHRAFPPAIGGILGETLEVWTIDIP